MIEFLIILGSSIMYLGLGVKFAATKYVQRDVQRELDRQVVQEIIRKRLNSFIPVSDSNDRAVTELKKSAAVESMFILPIWPIYLACINMHEYIVHNAGPTTYDLDKAKKEAEKEAAEYKKKLAELEAQDAEWRKNYEENRL